MRVYSLTVRNRAAALLLTLAVLSAGAALLVVGLALLAALGVAGGLAGLGVIAYRALRGPRRASAHVGGWRATGLDPSLEVFPDGGALHAPGEGREPNDASLPPGSA